MVFNLRESFVRWVNSKLVENCPSYKRKLIAVGSLVAVVGILFFEVVFYAIVILPFTIAITVFEAIKTMLSLFYTDFCDAVGVLRKDLTGAVMIWRNKHVRVPVVKMKKD